MNYFVRVNNGHVSRPQMRQCFVRYGILLSDEELYALEQRFNDDVGFNYYWFLKELDAKPFETPLACYRIHYTLYPRFYILMMIYLHICFLV